MKVLVVGSKRYMDATAEPDAHWSEDACQQMGKRFAEKGHTLIVHALSQADVLFIIGGRPRAIATSYSAEALEKPMLAIPSFGGAAYEVWEEVSPALWRLHLDTLLFSVHFRGCASEVPALKCPRAFLISQWLGASPCNDQIGLPLQWPSHTFQYRPRSKGSLLQVSLRDWIRMRVAEGHCQNQAMQASSAWLLTHGVRLIRSIQRRS
jgi:hypothetical protein